MSTSTEHKRALAPPASNLPAPPTPLVGRDDDVARAGALLLGAGGRLLTLTGPGGVGKTRLALAIAASVAGEFSNVVVFVDLAPLADPALVPPAVARALGLRGVPDDRLPEALAAHLRGRRTLLLLDNCEHLLPDLALPIDALLGAAPELTILATSRERLQLRRERVLPVPPLALPDPAPVASPEQVATAAVRLFVDRARAAKADFALTETNAATVAEICRRLDGLPLAIELAAARADVLSPPAMLARLERRQPLPGGGARDLPSRQRTMRDAIAWSHDLLDEDERTLFRRLAVFAGGFELGAAEAIAAATGDDPLDVLDGVVSLVDKSLLRQDQATDAEPRFSMLQTIREFGLERLEESGDERIVRAAHAAHFLALAARAEPAVKGPDQRAWVERLEREYDNLRAALRWFLGAGDAESALQLGSLLGYFWWIAGRLEEGRGWLGQSVALDGGTAPSRTLGLVWSAVLAYGQGDGARADDLAAGALALARARGERPLEAFATTVRGLVAWRRGDPETAARLHRAALRLAEGTGDDWMIGDLLFHLGMAEGERDPAAAIEPLTGSLERLRAAGGLHHLVLALGALADAKGRLGRTEEARSLFAEGLELGRTGTDPITAIWVATFALAFAAQRGQADRAVPLLAGLKAYATSIGYQRTPLEEAAYARAAAAARARLDGAAVTEPGAGRAMPLLDMLAATVALLADLAQAPAAATKPPPPGLPGGLSEREAEVLRLVAQGLSNGDIAGRLYISPRTVNAHLTTIYRKLDVTSRGAATRFAVEHGLA